MNLREFKTYIEQETLDMQLKDFRNIVENDISYINELIECEEAENPIPFEERNQEEEEDFSYQWHEISSVVVKDICNEMGWKYSMLQEKMSCLRSIEADCCYYRCNFKILWDEMNKCNDIEFFFVAIKLLDRLNSNTKLHNKLIYSIKNSINKSGIAPVVNQISKKQTVFIAMSYSHELDNAREIIKATIQRAGYKPVLMDEKDYNNFIVPEMFKEIEKSSFIVADITQHRTGVYYEAGYARALKKEVIFLCRENDFQNTHFDISQLNHLVWKKEEEIEGILYRRIDSTIGLY